MKRSHLTLDERYLIHTCLVAQFHPTDIAAECGCSGSAIHAECQRHTNAARARSTANAPAKSAALWQQIGAQLKGGHRGYFPGKAYVCDPRQPNQRGTNENPIGRLRADLPKGMRWIS